MAKLSSFSLSSSLLPLFTQNPYPFARQNIIFSRQKLRCSSTSATMTSTKAFEIPWGCEIESLESASELQQWLSDSGLPPQKMGIQRVEVGERGLVALKNIRKGEKLLFVPPSLVITADSVQLFFYKIFLMIVGKYSVLYTVVINSRYLFWCSNDDPFYVSVWEVCVNTWNWHIIAFFEKLGEHAICET